MYVQTLRRLVGPLVAGLSFAAAVCAAPFPPDPANQDPQRSGIVFKVRSAGERMEMTVHSSRILTLDQKIPQAQVNNPDVLELTPLSPNEIQVSAKAAGVTQINLWGEDKKIYTVDVIVFGDAQELTMLLRSQFPNAAIKVIPISNGVVISGYVDQPEHIDRIVRMAEEYYPKVINNMTVGGVQQVLLHVKVMEVSRTKLRRLGFDFTKITNGNVVFSGVSGLITAATSTGIRTSGTETVAFSVVDGSSAFFGVLEALREDNLAKVLAEPTLVTVSGRPAFFQVGGEFPILVPQSLGTVSIEYKKYGTQVDFVPIVLGNGRIRLEVRPRVSEIDLSRSVTLDSTTVPGLRTREVDTGVEMTAGQTLAIAGLVQERTEAQNRGLPWISEVPYLGVPFRKVQHLQNTIELLIMVTPELVEAMDAHEVPPCGPGMHTANPNDWELFMRGFIEVPNRCVACGGTGCGDCGPPGGLGPGAMEPQGMMPIPAEPVPTPHPDPSALRPGPSVRGVSVATRPGAVPGATGSRATPQNPYGPTNPKVSPPVAPPARPNSPPGFIGPVGYDVVN